MNDKSGIKFQYETKFLNKQEKVHERLEKKKRAGKVFPFHTLLNVISDCAEVAMRIVHICSWAAVHNE